MRGNPPYSGGVPKNTTARSYMVVPCAADKADHATTAELLYTSANYRLTLAAAKNAGCDEVLILSAKYGLLRLTDEVEPYDVKMGDAGCVTVAQVRSQACWLGLTGLDDADVWAMLPKAYFAVLDAALRSVDTWPTDVYEAAPGIGYQRGVAANVRDAA
jgi:hypothetical protein